YSVAGSSALALRNGPSRNFFALTARARRCFASARPRRLQHRRKAEAGRLAAASRGGDEYHHGTAASRLSGELCAEWRAELQTRHSSCTGFWLRASMFVGAVGSRCFVVACRLCQRRQPYVIAGRGAQSGNGRADSLWGKPMAHRSTTVDGEPAAFALRWRAGYLHLPFQCEVDSHFGNE